MSDDDSFIFDVGFVLEAKICVVVQAAVVAASVFEGGCGRVRILLHALRGVVCDLLHARVR